MYTGSERIRSEIRDELICETSTTIYVQRVACFLSLRTFSRYQTVRSTNRGIINERTTRTRQTVNTVYGVSTMSQGRKPPYGRVDTRPITVIKNYSIRIRTNLTCIVYPRCITFSTFYSIETVPPRERPNGKWRPVLRFQITPYDFKNKQFYNNIFFYSTVNLHKTK